MKKNLIFIFHGMGEDDKDSMKNDYLIPYYNWSYRYRFNFVAGKIKYFDSDDTIKETELDVSKLENDDLRNQYKEKMSGNNKFYLVTYNHNFKKILENWQTDLENLETMLGIPSGIPANISNIQKRIERINKDLEEEMNEFGWTHLGDVALYKLMKDVKSLVVYDILEKICDEIDKNFKKHGAENVRIHFIGHSLGTAVATDVVEEYFDLAEKNGYELPENALVDSIYQVANVSHLIVGKGLNLKPSNPKYGLQADYYGKYYNYRHVADIFTLKTHMFKPGGWGPNYYKSMNLEHITKDLISKPILEDISDKENYVKAMGAFHSFEHYMSNPEVLSELTESIEEDSILQTRKDIAKIRYRNNYSLGSEEVVLELLEKILKKIKEKKLGDAFREVLDEN